MASPDDFVVTTAHERFTLMLLERLQGLEDTIATLQSECTTDTLHALVVKPVGWMSDGCVDQNAFAVAFGEAIRLDSLDVMDVTMENRNETDGVFDFIANILNRFGASPTYITVRMRSKHPTRALAARLTSVFQNLKVDRVVDLKLKSAELTCWSPDSILACNAVRQSQRGSTWTAEKA